MHTKFLRCQFLVSYLATLAFHLAVDDRNALGQEIATGGNVCFLPGDAFFCASISRKQIDTLTDQDAEFKLRYSLPLKHASFGYCYGADELVFGKNNRELRSAISVAYQELTKYQPRRFFESRKDSGDVELVETNPLPVLVYPRQFVPTKYHMYERYNEHWFDKGHRLVAGNMFGIHPNIGAIEQDAHVSFLGTYESAIEDWRNSKSVQGLEFQSTFDSVEFYRPRKDTQLTISVDTQDCMVIVLETDDRNAFFRREAGMRWVVIEPQKSVVLKTNNDDDVVILELPVTESMQK